MARSKTESLGAKTPRSREPKTPLMCAFFLGAKTPHRPRERNRPSLLDCRVGGLLSSPRGTRREGGGAAAQIEFRCDALRSPNTGAGEGWRQGAATSGLAAQFLENLVVVVGRAVEAHGAA